MNNKQAEQQTAQWRGESSRTMRSTNGFLVRASGGRVGKEGEDGELDIDAELASDLELVRHARERHLEALGWG